MEWKEPRYIAGSDPVSDNATIRAYFVEWIEGKDSDVPYVPQVWSGYRFSDRTFAFGFEMVNTVLGYMSRETYNFMKSRMNRVGFDTEYSRQPKLLPQFCESLKQGDKDGE